MHPCIETERKTGFEPATFGLGSRRSTNWANSAYFSKVAIFCKQSKNCSILYLLRSNPHRRSTWSHRPSAWSEASWFFKILKKQQRRRTYSFWDRCRIEKKECDWYVIIGRVIRRWLRLNGEAARLLGSQKSRIFCPIAKSPTSFDPASITSGCRHPLMSAPASVEGTEKAPEHSIIIQWIINDFW